MATATKLSVIPCGAMTTDLTWLLLKPGRSITDRNHRDAPAPWVDCPTHCVLVETPEGRLLWDTSCPRDWEERWGPTGLQDFFPYDKVTEEEYLDSRLQQLGVGLDEIDYVVLSHLHFDHAGNVKMFEGTNAKLVCHEREKDFAFNFDGLFTGAHLKTDYEGLEFETVSGDTEFLPGRHAAGDPGPHHRLHVDAGRAARQRHHDLHVGRGLHGRQLGPAVHARRHRQQPGAVVLVGGEAARHPGAHERDDGLRARRRPDPPAPRGAEGVLLVTDPLLARGDDLHLGRAAAEVRRGRRGRDRVRPGRATACARVLIVTDPGVSALGAPSPIADALTRYDIEAEIFDGVHVEPTDDSMNKAVEYARAQGDWDGFVAVGGGSAIDTAKAINLLTSLPRRADGLHQQADRQREDPPGAAQAAGRGADDGGHRLGVHRDVRARHPVDEGQDRHQPLAAAPDPGRRSTRC